MSSAEWVKLVGTRLERGRVCPTPPRDLISGPETDSIDASRLVMSYSTPVGVAWVLERRRQGPKSDVVVWGDVPAASIDGVVPRAMVSALRNGVHGSLDGDELSLMIEGRRPRLAGRSTLVAQGRQEQWHCRTRRMVDVEIVRAGHGVVGLAETHVRVPRARPRLEPIDISLSLALLHGGWLNCVRGVMSNFTAADPMTSNAAATVAGALFEALGEIPGP